LSRRYSHSKPLQNKHFFLKSVRQRFQLPPFSYTQTIIIIGTDEFIFNRQFLSMSKINQISLSKMLLKLL
jgi:hypothetical protein